MGGDSMGREGRKGRGGRGVRRGRDAVQGFDRRN